MKKKNKVENKRLDTIDVLRGVMIILMIIFHSIYDYEMFSGNILGSWKEIIGEVSRCGFILIAGMSRILAKKNLKNGIEVSVCGIIITLATLIVMPSETIVFGILTFMGAAILMYIPLKKPIDKINPIAGMGVCFTLFLLLRNMSRGVIGIFGNTLLQIPDFFYRNYITSFFGFPHNGFRSSDYFPFFPWFFLFLTGVFLMKEIKKHEIPKIMYLDIKPLSFLGRHSLIIYMAHQVVIYGIFYLIYNFILG